jgi:hypothetical protein
VSQTGLFGTAYTLPAYSLAHDTNYYWKVVANGASKSVDAANAPFTFHTAVDGTPPTVAMETPADGSSDADVGVAIRIIFSEPIEKSTVLQSWITMTDGVTDIPGDVTSPTDRTIVFTPDSDLTPETSYTVTVSGSVEDLAANAMGADFVFSFTTWQDLAGFATGEGCLPGAGGGVGLVMLALAAAALRRRRVTAGSRR